MRSPVSDFPKVVALVAALASSALFGAAPGPHTLEEGVRIGADGGKVSERAVSALRGKTVLLLGDSIRLGYGQIVRDKLSGVADVRYPEENCRFAYYTLRGICDWVRLVPDPAKVDVVHWNCGLWDLGQRDGREPLTPIDVYAATIGRIADEIRHYFPNAKIVFATTTPLNPAVKSPWHTRGEGEIVRYNAAAVAELLPRGVLIDDLNGFVKREGLSREQREIVHFNPVGCNRLADEVIRFLGEDLRW